MSKTIINTPNAPAPIGPYNQAVWTGNLLFISGQVCIDPPTGDLKNGSIEEETTQVMENLGVLLRAAGLTYSDLVKVTIFLSDMAHYGAVNEVYGSYFTEVPPAREAVAVKALPRGVNVEISGVAVKG